MHSDELPLEQPELLPDPDRARPPDLRIVDPETGELREVESCPKCAAAENRIAALEAEVRGAEYEAKAVRGKILSLERALDAELARTKMREPEAVALFRYWQERCDHPRSELGDERMKILVAALKKWGAEACRRAIRGAAFAPTTQLVAGREVRYDELELIFRNEVKFESFRDRAPDPPETLAHRTLVETAIEVTKRIGERAKLFEGKDPDAISAAHLLLEVDRLIRDWREGPNRIDRPPAPEGSPA